MCSSSPVLSCVTRIYVHFSSATVCWRPMRITSERRCAVPSRSSSASRGAEPSGCLARYAAVSSSVQEWNHVPPPCGRRPQQIMP